MEPVSDAKSKSTAAKSTTAKSKSATTYKLYDRVMARWGDDGLFPAEIYKVYKNGNYGVYFPEDGEILRATAAAAVDDIRPPATPLPNWAKMSRKDFMDMEFEHTEKNYWNTPPTLGKYRVVGLGSSGNRRLGD